ncbi:MAG: hypothetical protein LBS68_02085 [Puniceicoccales bacterium]|jgi:hypothetical protein|nr:hypothetical protein [Puniceicoccales bacterium]
MGFTVSAFDRAKYGAVAGNQFATYVNKKNGGYFGGSATNERVVQCAKTLFLEVGELKFGEAVKNFFSCCAGFIVRLFTSDEKLGLQFTQKWLETRDCKHEDVKQNTDRAEIEVRFEKLMDAMEEAIGSNGCFAVKCSNKEGGKVMTMTAIGSSDKQRISAKLQSGDIKISGDTDFEKLASIFKGAFPGFNFIVTEKRSGVSDQASSGEVSGANTATPEAFIKFMESTVAITHGLGAKIAQRDAVQPVVDKAFGVLVGDESVNFAVDALHESLSGSGSLVDGIKNKEEFRKAFLWNVAHAAVKNQARQIPADKSDENVEINFSNFLQSDDPAVMKLVFKGILESEYLEEGQDAGDDNPNQAPNTFLANAFVAIGKATTEESVGQQIMDIGVNRFFMPMDSQKCITFLGNWDNGRLYEVIRLSSEEIVSREAAFELIKTKVVAAIPDILAAPSALSASAVPEKLGNDGENVASRFARTVQGTPFEGFSVAENVTEDKVNEVLSLLHDAYVFLLEMAKKTAELKDTEKFGIVLGRSAVFTNEDANRLREMQGQGRM